ncbi:MULTISPECIES: DNA-processing protein DprA [Anaeromyxobacter]|uniref:DNA-processing protein DprA n=1 Tax=Anaeromyxobacter TaxID=161492 RepID=UPI001F584ACD|nr:MULTISPECIES: DNA-processing protein DprA [unclassified Anaeromyxobacter]
MEEATTIRPGDGLYPDRLAQTPDRPAELRLRGALADLRRVAVVGSRHPDAYGEEMARLLAAGLARAGVSVVSGGALGIDAIAHRAALDAAGHTVAVLGTGVDVLYPASNRPLLQRVLAEGGAILSELPDGTPGFAGNFPRRNRIVSGLSEAVVVVQAGEKSGALITADWARTHGVPVFAVPGDAREPLSAGPIALLRRGAKVAASAEDVLGALGIPAAPVAERQLALPALAAPESALLAALARRPRHADEIARQAGLAPGPALAGLLTLELEGLCEQRPGHYFLRRT